MTKLSYQHASISSNSGELYLNYANNRHAVPDHVRELPALVFAAAIDVTEYAQVLTIGVIAVSAPAAGNACGIRLMGEVSPYVCTRSHCERASE